MRERREAWGSVGESGLERREEQGRAGKRGEEQVSAGDGGGGWGSVGLRRPIRGMKQGSHAAISVQKPL